MKLTPGSSMMSSISSCIWSSKRLSWLMRVLTSLNHLLRKSYRKNKSSLRNLLNKFQSVKRSSRLIHRCKRKIREFASSLRNWKILNTGAIWEAERSSQRKSWPKRGKGLRWKKKSACFQNLFLILQKTEWLKKNSIKMLGLWCLPFSVRNSLLWKVNHLKNPFILLFRLVRLVLALIHLLSLHRNCLLLSIKLQLRANNWLWLSQSRRISARKSRKLFLAIRECSEVAFLCIDHVYLPVRINSLK